MKKIKILGIGKSGRHSYYIFPKVQEVFGIVRDLLKELKINEWEGFGRPGDLHGETIFNKEDNIKKYSDVRFYFDSGEYYVEIVFGKDKVFLMVHTQKDRQQKIAGILGKYVVD